MLILKNAYVVQFQPAVVEGNTDIVIDGSEMIDVGQNIVVNYPDAKVIDLNGDMVTPGIVCSHNHFYSGLARGIMANIKPCPDFISILINLWWRLDRAIDEEILYSSGMVCVLDAIKTGTTAVIDHHASPSFIKGSLNVLKSCFEKVGLRGILCYETTDRNGKDGTKEGVEEQGDPCEGGGFRFPAMNHWATLRGPSGARRLQSELSSYLLKTHNFADCVLALLQSFALRFLCLNA